MCRRRPWWRPSSSPCAPTIMRRWADTRRARSPWKTCWPVTRSCRRGRAVSAVAARLGRWQAASAARAHRSHHRGLRRRRGSRARLCAGNRALWRHPRQPWSANFRCCAGHWARPIRCCRGRWRGAWPKATWPHRAVYITPMAAVAGAVADEMLQAMVRGRTLDKAYVNDGGDIAIHLTSEPSSCAPASSRKDSTVWRASRHERPVRGIATSGRGGRSFSLGIADSVTVLAATAAAADAAATMIANAVNVDHPAIERRPARDLDPDSDLGELAGDRCGRRAAVGDRRRGPGSWRCRGTPAAPLRPDRQRGAVVARRMAPRSGRRAACSGRRRDERSGEGAEVRLDGGGDAARLAVRCWRGR